MDYPKWSEVAILTERLRNGVFYFGRWSRFGSGCIWGRSVRCWRLAWGFGTGELGVRCITFLRLSDQAGKNGR